MYLFKTTNAEYGNTTFGSMSSKRTEGGPVHLRDVLDAALKTKLHPKRYCNDIISPNRCEVRSDACGHHLVLQDTIESTAKSASSAVPYAHSLPKPFPNIAGDAPAPRHVTDVLYSLSSHEFGRNPPSSIHVPDVYFPKSNTFSKSFAGREKEFAGLNTCLSRSRIHADLD